MCLSQGLNWYDSYKGKSKRKYVRGWEEGGKDRIYGQAFSFVNSHLSLRKSDKCRRSVYLFCLALFLFTHFSFSLVLFLPRFFRRHFFFWGAIFMLWSGFFFFFIRCTYVDSIECTFCSVHWELEISKSIIACWTAKSVFLLTLKNINRRKIKNLTFHNLWIKLDRSFSLENKWFINELKKNEHNVMQVIDCYF